MLQSLVSNLKFKALCVLAMLSGLKTVFYVALLLTQAWEQRVPAEGSSAFRKVFDLSEDAVSVTLVVLFLLLDLFVCLFRGNWK